MATKFKCPICNITVFPEHKQFIPTCSSKSLPVANEVEKLSGEQTAVLVQEHFGKKQKMTLKNRAKQGMNLFLAGDAKNDTLQSVAMTFDRWTGEFDNGFDLKESTDNIADELRDIAKNNSKGSWTRKFIFMLAEKVEELGACAEDIVSETVYMEE